MLSNLSTCKSPQQMFGALAKTYYAEKLGKKPEDIVVVSVMPCTAKKFECARPEMGREGYRDVDMVLTTRELARMIKMAGIDFQNLPDSADGQAARHVHRRGRHLRRHRRRDGSGPAHGLRDRHRQALPVREPARHSPSQGLEGVKEASITIEETVPEWAFLKGATLNVAVAHGLSNAQKVIDRIRSGEGQYHFVEVMTCPGGCIGGGGQPRLTSDSVREARIRAIYAEDEGRELRKSHENPYVQALYEEFLGEPLGPQVARAAAHQVHREGQGLRYE